MNNEAGRELLMNAIQGNGTAINQLASSLNCSTQQLQNAICQIQGQIQQVGKKEILFGIAQSMGMTRVERRKMKRKYEKRR